ncbi:MAG TPA: M56 family metallopeptidase [Chthonomonadaceae bacterium]|nr:M56 family metallopeptidase [Chthonomonadaceae bacterium]
MNSFPAFVQALPALCRAIVLVGSSLWIQTSLLLALGLAAGRALRRYGPRIQRFVYQATLLGVAVCIVLTGVLTGSHPSLFSLSLPEARTLPTQESASRVSDPARPSSDLPRTQSLNAATPVSASDQPHAANANGVRIDVQPDATSTGRQGASAFSESDHRPFLPENQPLQTSPAGWLYIGIAALWLTGVIAHGGWLLLCSLGIRRICRNSTPITTPSTTALLASLCAAQGLRVPRMRMSADIRSVYLAGLRRPVILLPESYGTDFDAPVLRAILTHEITHLALWDAWWVWGARLLSAVCWVQPLLLPVCRQMEQVCEEVCDRVALTQGCSPRVYAESLIALAERLTTAQSPRLLASGVVSVRSSLGQRVRKILHGPGPIQPPSAWFRTGIGVTLAGVVTALLFMVSATGAQNENAWDKDVRLNQKVAISAEGIPLRDLLSQLSQKTGLLLKADDYVADEKIILFTPARPLRDTLADLAVLFNDIWLPQTPRDNKTYYLLTRTLRAKEYEDGLAQDMNRKLLAQLDAQIKALEETPQELARRAPTDPIRKALSTQDGRIATSIFALLNDPQRAQLMANWRTQIPVALLSPAQKQGIEPLFFGDRFKPDANKGFVLDQIPREQMDKHPLTFTLNGYQGGLTVYMAAPVGFSMEVTTFSAGAKFLFPPHGNPYTGKTVSDVSGLPDPKQVAASQGASWLERLRALATKTGAPVIADFYRSKPIHGADGEQNLSNDPALQALDTLGRPEGYLWWTRGKALLWRKRDWYNQRLYEVPDRWVEAVGKSIKAHQDALTYADVLSLSDLSLDQLIGLNESLGIHTDRNVLSGVSEMLASLAACPLDKNAPLYKGIIVADTCLEKAVLPNVDDVRQRTLLEGFLRAFPRDLLGANDPHEFGYLIVPHDGGADEDPTGPAVHIDALFAVHRSLCAGYILALPTGLPDDRRANTKIEVTP